MKQRILDAAVAEIELHGSSFRMDDLLSALILVSVLCMKIFIPRMKSLSVFYSTRVRTFIICISRF